MPLVVWEAKDNARRKGVDVSRNESGKSVLDRYGACPCGGKWSIDDAWEKQALTTFADEVLRTFGCVPTVPPYVEPKAFTVGKPGTLPSEWAWLKEAMAQAGKQIAPFAKDDAGDVIIYNPGFWLGYVEDYNSTNLFWVEDGKTKGHARFNPNEVAGL